MQQMSPVPGAGEVTTLWLVGARADLSRVSADLCLFLAAGEGKKAVEGGGKQNFVCARIISRYKRVTKAARSCSAVESSGCVE
jgi:hypothetical protein